MSRRRNERPMKLSESQRLDARMKLMDLLFAKGGEWEFYSSPGGYSFLKVKVRKEQAA